MKRIKFLKSPWAIFLGILIGTIFGLEFKKIANAIKPFGDVYIIFLQMCVIPIMVSAIVTSVGRLVKSKAVKNKIYRIIAVFVISLLLVAILSLGIGVLYKEIIPTNPNELESIGQIVINSSDEANSKNQSNGSSEDMNSNSSIIHEIDSRRNDAKNNESEGIIDLLKKIIPANVFTALSSGDTLKILFFFLVMGIMLKFISNKTYETIMDLAEGVYEAFNALIGISMYFLPFGLMALVANQISGINGAIISSLVGISILIYITSFFILLISSITIWKFTHLSFKEQISKFRDVFIITLFARNSIAAIPSAIQSLSKIKILDKGSIDLTVPLGVIIFRFGTLMSFSVMSVYAMNLYNVSYDMSKFILIVGTAILASMATSGAPGIVSKMMIALVLNIIRVPSSAIVVLLIALDPIIDPVLTLLNVYPNCAAVAVISNVGEKKESNLDNETNQQLIPQLESDVAIKAINSLSENLEK